MSRPEPRADSRLSVGGLVLDVRAYCVQVDGRRVPLRPRELELLRVLMENADRVLSFRRLLELVWEQRESEDYRSVKTHVLRLRRKIEADPHAPSHIRTVRGVGYVFDRHPVTSS